LLFVDVLQYFLTVLQEYGHVLSHLLFNTVSKGHTDCSVN